MVEQYPPTAGAILTESTRRTGINVDTPFARNKVNIDFSKYRSQRRKDQLIAVKRLMIVGVLLFAEQCGHSLQQWNRLLLPAFNVAAWDFPTAFSETPMQRARAP